MMRSLALGLVVLLVLLGAYAIYWYWAAQRFEAAILDWADERRRAGAEVHLGTVSIDGFPLTLNAHFDGAVLAETVRPVAWELRFERLTVSLLPWSFAGATLASEAPVAATLVDLGSGARWNGTATRVAAALGFERGRLHRVDASLREVVASGPSLPETRIDTLAGTFEAVAADRHDLSLRARDIALPEGTVPAVGDVGERLVATLSLQGPPPRRLDRAALAAWRDAGGALDIAYFQAQWGPVTTTVTGRVALDANLQPAGRFTTETEGYRAAVSAVEAAGAMTPQQAAQVRLALDVAAQRPSDGGAPRLVVDLDLENRQLSAGLIPLATVPRLVWPGS